MSLKAARATGFIVDRAEIDIGQTTLTVLDLSDSQVLPTVVTHYTVPVSVANLVTYVLAPSATSPGR